MDNDKIKVEETSENSVDKVGSEEKVDSEEKLSIKKNKIIKYIVYGIILILALCGRNLPTVTEFDLGDFGSIVPLLLQSVAFMGLKWLPIFSVVGLLVTAFEERLGDFPNGFLIIVIFVTVVSFGLLFLL